MIAPTLTTDRLLITALSLDHWEAFAAAWADPRMTEFIGGKPRTRNESWGKFLQGIGLWPLLGYGYWAFIDKQTGDFLGNGGLAQGFPKQDGRLSPTLGDVAWRLKACRQYWVGLMLR
jgi:RimJ/RimL family protein N-acetyltransferase